MVLGENLRESICHENNSKDDSHLANEIRTNTNIRYKINLSNKWDEIVRFPNKNELPHSFYRKFYCEKQKNKPNSWYM